MSDHLLISALGPDKTGLVEELTEAVLEEGCNIADSRMAVLGDHFSVLMLLTGDSIREDRLRKKLEAITSLEITMRRVKPRAVPGDVLTFSIKIMGGDARGIVHAVTNYLKSKGVNIASLETQLNHAPHSGTEIFSMHLLVELPRKTSIREFKEELVRVCDDYNLDVDIEPVAG